ncbi:MAG: hypothetical protein F4036_07500 [Gammaproteobacteria bacterium]|nr:hypothetical protein [Gammaproteobacteria bacterium]
MTTKHHAGGTGRSALLAACMALCAVAPSVAREVPWEALDSDLKEKYRTAGTRGERRPDAEARKVRATVPENVRVQGPDAERFSLRDMDWSHKTPYAMRGSDRASNGVFESSERNRARGARIMSAANIRDAEKAHQTKGRAYRVLSSAKGAGVGAATAAAISSGVVIYKHHHYYLAGCMTRNEAAIEAGKEVAVIAGVGAAAGAAVVAVMKSPIAPIGLAALGAAGIYGIYTIGEELFLLLDDEAAAPMFVDTKGYAELSGYIGPLGNQCAIGEITIAEETADNPGHWIWVHDSAGQPFTLYRDVFRVDGEIGIGPHKAMAGWVDPPRLP